MGWGNNATTGSKHGSANWPEFEPFLEHSGQVRSSKLKQALAYLEQTVAAAWSIRGSLWAGAFWLRCFSRLCGAGAGIHAPTPGSGI